MNISLAILPESISPEQFLIDPYWLLSTFSSHYDHYFNLSVNRLRLSILENPDHFQFSMGCWHVAGSFEQVIPSTD